MTARRRRIVRWVLVGVVVLLGLFIVATARLFLWPPSDRPTRVDAVVALGGDPGQLRAKQAIRLRQRVWPQSWLCRWEGSRRRPVRSECPGGIDCFRADPLNTRGEAEYVAALAARRHWNRLIVVSERSQTTRAGCSSSGAHRATLVMVPIADPGGRLAYDVAYEWASLAKALVVVRSC